MSSLDKDSGCIATEWLDFSEKSTEDYCNCGGSGVSVNEQLVRLQDDRTLEIKCDVILKETGGGVSLKVNVCYHVTRFFGETSKQVKCVSTGKLEQRVHELVKAKLARLKRLGFTA
jgi:hypothetical protein